MYLYEQIIHEQIKQNPMKSTLLNDTLNRVEYLVFVQDTEHAAPRKVGTWRTQAQATAHKNRMLRSSEYYSVEWQRVTR